MIKNRLLLVAASFTFIIALYFEDKLMLPLIKQIIYPDWLVEKIEGRFLNIAVYVCLYICLIVINAVVIKFIALRIQTRLDR